MVSREEAVRHDPVPTAKKIWVVAAKLLFPGIVIYQRTHLGYSGLMMLADQGVW
jgi:hypothetical protein